MGPLRAYDAAAFARISQELLAQPAVEHTLEKVVELAVQNIEGCDYASITLQHGKKVETPAATDPLVVELDQWQYELNEGPCLSAVFVDDVYVIEDMTKEQRWPNWTPKAAAAGIMSILSVRLSTPRHVVGGLNLYSKAWLAYDEDEIITAMTYAAHASNAIEATSQIAGYATGMRTRHMIGMAQGLLMQRYHLTEEQAFQFLARTSQDGNTKLREVAARIINEANTHGYLP
jgi:GAF domain-containing protein